MALTAKQQRFVAEYLVDLNATAAYIRAGYVARGNAAEVNASRLLRNAQVAIAVQQRMKAREQRTEITQDRVLKELAKIGFADIRRAVKWGDGIAVTDPESGAVKISNGVALVGSEQIDDDTAAAVSEISQTAQGIKIKLHDKQAALVSIGRHLGMFTDKTELTGKGGGPLEFTRIERTIVDPK